MFLKFESFVIPLSKAGNFCSRSSIQNLEFEAILYDVIFQLLNNKESKKHISFNCDYRSIYIKFKS